MGRVAHRHVSQNPYPVGRSFRDKGAEDALFSPKTTEQRGGHSWEHIHTMIDLLRELRVYPCFLSLFGGLRTRSAVFRRSVH